jgi:hypothetical protein
MQEEPTLSQLTPGVSVSDKDGNKLGTVERVYRRDPARTTQDDGGAGAVSDEIVEVKTGVFGLGKHLYVPMRAVETVTEEGAFLDRPREEVERAEWTSPPQHLNTLV